MALSDPRAAFRPSLASDDALVHWLSTPKQRRPEVAPLLGFGSLSAFSRWRRTHCRGMWGGGSLPDENQQGIVSSRRDPLAADAASIGKSSRFLGKVFRMPEGSTKTFEFDAIGVFVWESIDGRITVQQLIRKLARRYGLSEREAAVSTNLFLQMLGKKSLIGWNVPEGKKKE